ncbi:MAG TPA: 2-oxoacid:ferredoxin oxidoreductase subunit beta, partial [Dehalococcoidia bacterium]|nr:2-oxoacid:ferredoxin oxidoreductase subunit beta [Dehalococcoidia bacterium]
LGAEAAFVARSLDVDPHHMLEVLRRAYDHKGASFVEIYQNCNIYNDGAFEDFSAKDVRADRMLFLKHGEPMIFGKQEDKGIRINGLKPEVVELGKDGITEKDILIHDETIPDPTVAFLLSRMDWPEFPVPVGVMRAVQRPTYNDLMQQQIDTAIAQQGEGDINALLRQGDTWEVE